MKAKILPLFIGWAALPGVFVTAPPALHAQSPAPSGTVITIAGNGSQGFSGDGGPATNAMIGGVNGLAVGPDGTLYFADTGNYRVRAVDPASGIVRTFAGNGGIGDTGNNGPATNATFLPILGLAADRSRNALYVADHQNNWVRKVNLTNGLLTAYAGTGPGPFGFEGDGGPATLAQFNSPERLALDAAGNLFISDALNWRIRQVDPVSGIITTIAGNGYTGVSAGDRGPATNASFTDLSFVAADRLGNVFAADDHRRVRRIDALTGIITTIAGGGTNAPGTGLATNMNFTDIGDMAADDAGELYLAGNYRVFKLNLASGLIAPYAGDGIGGSSGGDGGPATNATFGLIAALAVPPGGGLIIADAFNARIRYVVPDSIHLTNDSGQTSFYLPWVSALAGDLTVANNPNLTNIIVAALTNVEGDVEVSGNTSARNVDLSSVSSVTGDVLINDNAAAGSVDLSGLGSAGDVSVSGNSSATNVDLSSLLSVTGDVVIGDNTSAQTIALGSISSVPGNVTIESNAPDAVVDLSNLTTFGCGTNEVTMTLDGGTVQMTNGLTLCTNATLTGSTAVEGSVTNSGTIEPGASPGQLNLTGHLVLANPSRLRLEIGGYAPGQFDVVNVAGSVALGGALAVSLVNSFPSVMTNGASFTVLTGASPVLGAFANVTNGGSLTTTEGYARFTVLYAGESTVRLTDLVIVDTDADSMPDWWEDQFGLSKTNSADAALDLDGDGASNLNEFAAGTKPNDAASVFRITGAHPVEAGLRVSWSVVGGKSYLLQTNAATPGGGLGTNFGDFSPLVTVPDTGQSETNVVDPAGVTNAAGGYYRVRLAP